MAGIFLMTFGGPGKATMVLSMAIWQEAYLNLRFHMATAYAWLLGSGALVQAPPGTDTRWNGPYLKKRAVPKDPWGYDYHYRFPGEHDVYDLYSLGADNAQGGSGEDADILSWE